jgi:hypothetical protein
MISTPLVRFTLTLLAACFVFASCESEHSPMCGEGATSGNNDVPPAFQIEMGKNVGSFAFNYETRNAKDQVIVKYEGNVLFDSGCVGETRKVILQYGPGRASHVDVVMNPNCEDTPMTSWQFKVGCPAPTPRLTGAAHTSTKPASPRH